MVTISTGYRNGRRSFDFFRFLRVDRQNLCWACVLEWGFVGGWVITPFKLRTGAGAGGGVWFLINIGAIDQHVQIYATKSTYRNNRSSVCVQVLPCPLCGVGLVLRSQMSIGLINIGVCPLGTFLHSGCGGSRWQRSRSGFVLQILNTFHLPSRRDHLLRSSMRVNNSFLTWLVVVSFGRWKWGKCWWCLSILLPCSCIYTSLGGAS